MSGQASLDAIFCTALDLDTDEARAAYLDRICGEDTPLRRRVEQLLHAHAASGSFLQLPETESSTTIDAATLAEEAGTRVGPYKLLQIIGQGGMGVVWRAEQEQPVRRQVALKIIRPGMDSRQIIARFEIEQQALALMDHVNIARVLDAGTTENGRPYFVMELIHGIAITQYCDDKQLTLRERLELFVPVCQAIQHAHQKGIIHRDIKPSNVLIAEHEGRAVPKVIDFGVAKAIGQRLTEGTVFTHFGAILGTFEYMSPEQADNSAQGIDTRSDIYSLGVLLYELLTGTTPLESQRLRTASFSEIVRLIVEEEPDKPSTRLSQSPMLPAVAATRKVEPAKLVKQVRGELDWIVMKALEKDRNRRYGTASGLASEIQRYLADEPLACQPSRGYRLRKFARRNKSGVAVAALVLFFIALLGGGAGWAVRDRVEREHKTIQERLDRVQLLTSRVELILEEVDRQEQDQKWPEALAALERAEAVLNSGEADDTIRGCVGQRRRELTFVAQLDRIQLRRALQVEGKLNNAGAARDYAAAFRAYGVDVEALPTEEAVAQLRRNPALAVALAGALDDWVAARRLMEEAEPRWKPLIAVARGVDPDQFRDRLRALEWAQPVPKQVLSAELLGLAKSIDVKAQRPVNLRILAASLEGAQLTEAALRILLEGQCAYPADYWLNYQLGEHLNGRKDYVDAVRYYSIAVSLRPDSIPAHNNLGVALANQGKVDEAIREYRRTIELDPESAIAHNNLGSALRVKKQFDEAILEFRTAIKIDPKVATIHVNFGLSLHARKQSDKAIHEFRTAIELDPNYPWPHYFLGCVLREKGQWGGAIAELRKALELDPKNTHAHRYLGEALHRQGRFAEAEAAYREAIRLNPDWASFHDALAWLLATCDDRESRNYPQAIESAKRAVQLAPHEWNYWNTLGVAYLNGGQLDAAENSLREAIRLKPDWPPAHHNLRLILQAKGRLHEAIAEFNKEIELDPKNAGNHNELAWLLATWPDPKVRDPQRAVALAKKAIKLSPSSRNYWNTLGAAHYRGGDWKAAALALKKSMELRNGGNSEDWFFLAMAHWKLGEKDLARQWYDKAVQWMDKNDPKNDELCRFRSEAAELLGVEKKSK
jgi:Flp pilus assembly protein TadD/serine/threonine protein kinase